jgi:hypothetical protein
MADTGGTLAPISIFCEALVNSNTLATGSFQSGANVLHRGGPGSGGFAVTSFGSTVGVIVQPINCLQAVTFDFTGQWSAADPSYVFLQSFASLEILSGGALV